MSGTLSMSWPERWCRHRLPWYMGWLAKWRGTVTIDGCRFDVSGPEVNRFMSGVLMLGRYEQKERVALRRFLDPSLPVIECGASSGIISCLTNKRLLHPSEHVVIEGSPALIPLLTRNRDLNRCQFRIVHGAVAYGTDAIQFEEGAEDLVVGRVSPDSAASTRTVAVRTVTLAGQIEARGWPACTLVCDIEGAEIDLFVNEIDLIAQRVRWVLLETHRDRGGADSFDRIHPLLSQRSFTHVWRDGDVHVFRSHL